MLRELEHVAQKERLRELCFASRIEGNLGI